mmetsp:Transcript_6402/g.12787  ORF Transcript_6402/g.12787 Transcript_6402/m.12787 type:complete len:488 (-) Transcript_6402:381-1844(-)
MEGNGQRSGMDNVNDEALVTEAIFYASTNGIVMVSRNDPKEIIHAPFTLRPSRLPRTCFDLGRRLCAPFNRVIDALARDETFLEQTLGETAQVDPFTGHLLEIYLRTKSNPRKVGRIGITRYDYFAEKNDTEGLRMSQVEMNTIAASFGSLSARTTSLHRHLFSLDPRRREDDDLPVNDTPNNLAKILASAHQLYCQRRAIRPENKPIIAFIVQPGERNSFDQDILRETVWTLRGIRAIRISLCELASMAEVDPTGSLLIQDKGNKEIRFEVSVAYFRAGYAPTDYPSEKEWTARSMIEESAVLSCPSVAYQLAGAKKVQQVLYAPGVLEKFALDQKDAELMRQVFVGQWGLDMSNRVETELAVQAALDNPQAYVLKPQREGGGNNLYGLELAEALRRMTERERAAFILMQRINPIAQENIIVRATEMIRTECVSEIGFFGLFLAASEPDQIMVNGSGGFLLRSKAANVEDGGVAAGVAVLDSPALY